MNMSLISKITQATLIASLSSLAITPSASAFNFNLSGTFEDGGTLGGSFNYDGANYSNFNIVTTGGSSGSNLVPSGTTYNDSDDLFGDGVTGFFISKSDLSFDLNLSFDSDISTTSKIISLDTTDSYEIDYFVSGNTRSLSSGEIVAVPFEPSANLAIFVILGFMGVNYYRKRFQS